jgi:hypothetical protein
MKDGERLTLFWKRWNRRPDDAAEFLKFRIRMTGIAADFWDNYIRHSSPLTRRFAFVSGTEYEGRASEYNSFVFSALRPLLENAKTFYQVVEAIQFLLWTLESWHDPTAVQAACVALNKVFDITPNVPVQVVFKGKEAVIYPSGAELLDEALIESNLLWLQSYPDVLKSFQGALKLYLGKDPRQYRNVLDNLRFAVEQMVRAVLKNEKSLENQKEVFLKWLAARDAHVHIVAMFNDLLFSRFPMYQNEAVKHKEDRYTPDEVEFTLYLVGTFLRFIQQLAERPAIQGSPK